MQYLSMYLHMSLHLTVPYDISRHIIDWYVCTLFQQN